MKKITSLLLLSLFFITLQVNNAYAQKKDKRDTATIVSSAECNMCKEKIEKEIGVMKGVKKIDVDVATHNITVIYDPSKTTLDKIRTAISNIGYDADSVKANNRAQQKLPDCCKPGQGKADCDKPGGK